MASKADELGLSFDDAGGPGATAAPPEDLGLGFDDAAGFVPKAPAAAAPSPAGEWGPGLDILDRMLLGGFQPAVAYAGQAGAVSPAKAQEAATERQARMAQASAAWRKEHPAAAELTEMAGGAIPALAALSGQEWALAPLAARLAAMGRPVEAIVNALRGTAGSEMPGVGGMAVRAGSRAIRGGVEGGEGAAIEAGRGQGGLEEQAARGATLGAVANPLLRSFMPRAVILSPHEARAIEAHRNMAHTLGLGFEMPQLYHPSTIGRYAEAAVRRAGSEAKGSPISAGILGVLAGSEAPQAFRFATEMIPGGGKAAAAAAIPAVAGAVGNRYMMRPDYQERILQGALGNRVYPYSRVNPLLPFMNPMINPSPELQ